MGSKPKTPKKSATQKKLESYQLQDIEKLRATEAAQKAALKRGRLGRASLMSGAPVTMESSLPKPPPPPTKADEKRRKLGRLTKPGVGYHGTGLGKPGVA